MEKIKGLKYKQADHVLGSSIDEAMIITSTEDDKFYGMNKIATAIWSLLDSPISEEDVVKSLLKKFEVDQKRCEEEVNLFFQEMKQALIISEVV
jgi:hypothetical protein